MMTKLELQALKEAQKLLDDFQMYKFHHLIHKTKDLRLMEEYRKISDEEHSKVINAKKWIDTVLDNQK